jgi:methionyl-tRNA formyltransferase
VTLDEQASSTVHDAQGHADRLVMLTTGSAHGAGILAALAERRVRLSAVILESPAGTALAARVRDIRRRGFRELLAATGRRVRARARPSVEPWRRAAYYTQFADAVVTVPSLTGEEALEQLERLAPDVIVLGGAPILPDRILAVARLGVLNAHPGWLPEYRGVDVVAHAVLGGGPIGATVHFVDTGIDTGRIVERVRVEPVLGEGLDDLQRRVEAAGGRALAHAADRLLRNGSLPTEDHARRHPLCRRLPPERRRAADALLRNRRS